MGLSYKGAWGVSTWNDFLLVILGIVFGVVGGTVFNTGMLTQPMAILGAAMFPVVVALLQIRANERAKVEDRRREWIERRDRAWAILTAEVSRLKTALEAPLKDELWNSRVEKIKEAAAGADAIYRQWEIAARAGQVDASKPPILKGRRDALPKLKIEYLENDITILEYFDLQVIFEIVCLRDTLSWMRSVRSEESDIRLVAEMLTSDRELLASTLGQADKLLRNLFAGPKASDSPDGN